ncbi:MAG: hypothetical protein AAGF07_01150 [Patescibacteria group bacterium]
MQKNHKPNSIDFKNSLVSLAKSARNSYLNRPTRDLNGSEGLLVRTLGTHTDDFYVSIYFDSDKNK